MPLPVKEAAALAGRLLLSALFLHEAWSKLTGYSAAVAYAQAFGVPERGVHGVLHGPWTTQPDPTRKL
jgi:putative oxidoreductase